MSAFSVLTVCTGNVCRSPLAELLLRDAFDSKGGISVSSAGTAALVGEPMTEQTADLAENFGLTLPRAHVSRSLTVEMLRGADLVLALSREHRSRIAEMLPAASRRTFTLREFARLVSDLDAEERSELSSHAHEELSSRFALIVDIAASRRGLVVPPESAADDDVIDPYRQSDAVYRESADQILPAVQAIYKSIGTDPASKAR